MIDTCCPYGLPRPAVVLAPMAGVTDLPFRQLCRHWGAMAATSEMVSANPDLRGHHKTLRRLDHRGEGGPRIVQIVGHDPDQLADAARQNVDRGADMIDINLGCPAKKVTGKLSGSALLRDEPLVAKILTRVAAAVSVPVTLKMRTGWSPESRNAVAVARLAEAAGIHTIALHGRTRQCGYRGVAEYETATAVKRAVAIPVLVNGDIDTAEKARYVLNTTGADGVMIGRAAQGKPWLFKDINHFLRTGEHPPPPPASVVAALLLQHLDALYSFYGTAEGVRIARKHLSWYCRHHPGGETFWRSINQIDNAREQHDLTAAYFAQLTDNRPAASSLDAEAANQRLLEPSP